MDQSQAAQDASDCLCLVEAHDRDGLPFRHSEACLRLGHLFVAPSGGRSPVQLARQRGLPLPPRYSAERSKRATLRDDQDEARGWFRRAAALGSGEGATRLRADRFVLASRSDYFCASLRRGDSSFQEGAAGRWDGGGRRVPREGVTTRP